ncbi:MAG: DUF881 domain-containing protein [Candidatus Sericytochromatia bacterium]
MEKQKRKVINTWQLSVAGTSLILGFLLSVQFKSQAEQRARNIPSRRIEDIANLLKESEEKRKSLEKTVAELLQEVNRLKSPEAVSGSKDLQDKMILTGFTSVIGQGVIVTINDSKKALENGDNPANGIVHNEDLLKITNELRSSGAEAISINENRLIANSEISCAGPTILVNKNRLTPPFEIKAIGKPDTMLSALNMRGGIIETLKFFGLEIKLEKKTEVKIPAYNGLVNFKYSKSILNDPEKEGL